MNLFASALSKLLGELGFSLIFRKGRAAQCSPSSGNGCKQAANRLSSLGSDVNNKTASTLISDHAQLAR
jgi:hypothetical protein